MAKIDPTKTELVWPGKYNDDGTPKEVPRVSLPFQGIETVKEIRATREKARTPPPAVPSMGGVAPTAGAPPQAAALSIASRAIFIGSTPGPRPPWL